MLYDEELIQRAFKELAKGIDAKEVSSKYGIELNDLENIVM